VALTPIVLALSKSGEPTAHKIAKALGCAVHGREGRVDVADAYFANALDHARDLFAAGTPVLGVCASGILIRGVAPLLADKTTEPPVVSVSDDGAVVVPLLGGHRGRSTNRPPDTASKTRAMQNLSWRRCCQVAASRGTARRSLMLICPLAPT